MALNQNKNGKWVYDRWFGRERRVQVTFPASIKTREEAERYIPLIPPERFRGLQQKFRRPLKTLFSNAIAYFRSMHDIDFHNNIEPFMEYCIANEIKSADVANLTPSIVEKYSGSRITTVSAKKHNREIRAIAQFHNYLANQGACVPFEFEIEKFYIGVKKGHDSAFSEKFFELLIEKYPREFLGRNYKSTDSPVYLEGLFPDSIFKDEDGDYFVLEIQKGRLDRDHTYKILDYRDKMESELRKTNEKATVGMMVVLIGDQCPPDRELFLKKYGIKFIKLPIPQVEKIILRILGTDSLRTSSDNQEEKDVLVSTDMSQ